MSEASAQIHVLVGCSDARDVEIYVRLRLVEEEIPKVLEPVSGVLNGP